MSNFFIDSQVELFPDKIQATVVEKITSHQPGRVWCRGSYWPARLYQLDYSITLEPSQQVFAVGIEGITLLIVSE
ncbi:NfeD family protein [Floridanema aerugineum]|uniref:NfeD family protein n=1 Tax=Floridaenema aerugineum BLCC-F46 TaxID=3153654 RepID=A0ABV4X772_9CYAN